MKRLHQFLRDETGASASEFALVLPAVLIMLFGAMASGVMMYTAVKLQHATEDAARCYSAQRDDCASDAASFATNYPGLILDDLAFSAGWDDGCEGYKVTTSGTFNFLMGQGVLSAPVSTQACYPGFEA